MIFGPKFDEFVQRIHPIDGDRSEDKEGRKQRRVLYQGRAWGETEEELPVQPNQSAFTVQARPKLLPKTGVYADRVLLERATHLLEQMTTLEEKVAQLCFYETEAIYDAVLQHEVELIIQMWQIGGILFTKGDYKRQAYLIERYQEVSKIALLMANDFLHGFSFYLQGDVLPEKSLPEQRFADLGKAVMVQNRRLGVHVQFDQERSDHQLPLSSKQVRGFRRGIREAHGIVGKEKCEATKPLPSSIQCSVPAPSPAQSNLGGNFSILAPEFQVQETIGFKTLSFFDATKLEGSMTEALYGAFSEHYEIFLFRGKIAEGIKLLCKLVRSGRISEEELDRRIMKVLIIKAHFQR